MCKHCDKQVIEMGILESDLPHLPFKLAKWQCMAASCSCTATIRDYGIAPFYWWPVNIRRDNNGWRGGWFDATDHGRLCSRHYVNDWRQVYREFYKSERQLIDMIVIGKQKK